MTSAGISPEQTGAIFDIQGLSVHDGPGCRTLIFLNGCTLNCAWCSNPEGISTAPSLMHFTSRCIGCGNCMRKCIHDAIHMVDGKPEISRIQCSICDSHSCVEECYTDALKVVGYRISVSALMSIIRRDRQYWGSQGGITLTGGEPLLQPAFVKDLLAHCYHADIHTAIETCGNVPWKNFEVILPVTDWIFFDLKHPSSGEHRRGTTAGNELILENALKLAHTFEGRLVFRLPVIPGYNDGEEAIRSLISFLKTTGRNEINILPLHHLGRQKYSNLNREYPWGEIRIPTVEQMGRVEAAFRSAGVACYSGSETPF